MVQSERHQISTSITNYHRVMNRQTKLESYTVKRGTCQGQFKYKINIYTHDGLAPSIALLKFEQHAIGMCMPLVKQAYDRRINRCETMMYFAEADQAYAMMEALKFVGRKYAHDSTLITYDWTTQRSTILEKISCHPKIVYADE